ncbi:DUF1376 domain-containing protein [Bartonella queenslandensis]|uniref:DUF1376 domain-containing protein n=1 Tax=Bartonella queenslandensis TaxID=481138 RepID=UPI000688144E|nr:DUF1376 domain-containing protein [Bartonella queenslandensis]
MATKHINTKPINIKEVKLPWIKFYLYDWISDTYEMTPEQRGIYLTLLLRMYDKKEPLTDDFAMLSRFCNCSTRKFGNVVEYLIKIGKVTKTDDGSLWKPELEKDLKTFEEEINLANAQMELLYKINEQIGGKYVN